jgi:DNA-3-methyladenine glycosylase II
MSNQMAPLAEPWRPLRDAAARLWWAYYNALKQREGVIGEPPDANGVAKKISAAKRSRGA